MSRGYNPKKGSAGYALLVALYFTKDEKPNGIVKDELILIANKWSTTPIEYNKQGQVKSFNPMGPMYQNYTGWSSMSSTLIKSHELVEEKRQSKNKSLYRLTEKGNELAAKIIDRDNLSPDGVGLFGGRPDVAAPATAKNKKSREKTDDQSRKKARTEEEVFMLADDDDNDDDDDDDDDDDNYDYGNNNIDNEYGNYNIDDEYEMQYESNGHSSSSSTALRDARTNDFLADNDNDNNRTHYANYNDNNNFDDGDLDPDILEAMKQSKAEADALAKAMEEEEKMLMLAIKYSDVSKSNNTDYTCDYHDDKYDDYAKNLQSSLDNEYPKKQNNNKNDQEIKDNNEFIYLDDSDDDDDNYNYNNKKHDSNTGNKNDSNTSNKHDSNTSNKHDSSTSNKHDSSTSNKYDKGNKHDINNKSSDLFSMLDTLDDIDIENSNIYKENMNNKNANANANTDNTITKPPPPVVEFPKCEHYDQYEACNYSARPIGNWFKDGCLTWDQFREPCPWYLAEFSLMASSSLFIDYFDIILLVTSGENDCLAYLNTELKKYQEEVRHKKPNCTLKVESRHLNIGDFMWIGKYKRDPSIELVLNGICERKTYTDFLGSITNNQGLASSRYMSQKRRLMFSGISTRLYLLEGTQASAVTSARNSGKHKNLSVEALSSLDLKNKKILNTAMPETQLAGFTIVQTDNPKATANFLLSFTRRLVFSPKVGYRNLHEMMNDTKTPKIYFADFDNAFKTREVLGRSNVRSITGRVLLGITGISTKTVSKIMDKYPTLRELYDSLNSDNERENFIAYMSNGSDKKRVNNILNVFTKSYL